MLFNSFIFIVFAVVFFTVWPFAKRNLSFRLGTIVSFSFLFYGWWDWRFLFLILFTGLWDFFAAILIDKHRKYGRFILILSLAVNLGALVFFKYSIFLAENFDTFFQSMGLITNFRSNLPEFSLILPIGISFYTFQSMSYTIDVYRGDFKPTDNAMLFLASISLFPHLVAGPIVRAHDFIPQLQKYRDTNETERFHAFKLIMIGYFKKLVLADNLAGLVNYSFENEAGNNSSIFWWIAILTFAFQIYFDFSGYTDIARGLAKLMGYHFRMNFNHPYLSGSIRDFWNRWHISLSTWFRDYVYIPLGGSRKGRYYGHRNMWITMLLSGFWHGANWTYIIWGALHAFYLSIERITRWPHRISQIVIGKYISVFFVMVQVMIAWVFFRAINITQSINIIKKMFSINLNLDFLKEPMFKQTIVFLLLCVIIEVFIFYKIKPTKWFGYRNKFAEIIYVALLIVISIYFRGKGDQFIYFQF